MKKVLCLLTALCLIFLVGCSEYVTSNNVSTDNPITNESVSKFESNDDMLAYTIDYNDAKSFENALNNGSNVNGRIVKFYVSEYVPDSALGINCHAGEHLNFIFKNELNIEKGDTIIVRVTEEPSKIFLIGSWEIHCDFLGIYETEQIESDNETEFSSADENKGSETTGIILTLSEDDFKGMNYKDAEKCFREMGFTKFEYKTVGTDNKSFENTICYVEIVEFILGDSSFEKGDRFDFDSTIVVYTYKYEEPKTQKSASYSTNDYETAKNGNTGIFSYKSSDAYDVYWIIDFDSGYAYMFTDGNGDTTCDKVRITSGSLNDRVTVTWNIDGERTDWYLHFKYKNTPATLVTNDHYGVAMEFETTNLDNALSILGTKTIMEF